ncbi:MAG: rhomboid family intramembrane serine protease [Thermodesulfobacteriota bacterium]
MQGFNSLDEEAIKEETVVFRSRNYKRLMLWSLVLQSAGLVHRLVPDSSGWSLLVSEEDVGKARIQIQSFERENRDWPPVPEEPVNLLAFPHNRPPTVLVMGMLLIFFWTTGPWSEAGPWFNKGAVDSVQVLEKGEWWRLVTGLTLHSDARHLLGNLLIGGFISHLLGKILGGGLAWFLILLSGSLGNYFNILFRDEYHLSVGFSTAVFGAIGILAGMEIKRSRSLKAMLLPFGAALALMSLLGSGGGRTDLGAHWSGLSVGVCLGLAAAFFLKFFKKSASLGWQFLFFVLTAGVIWGSWFLALGNYGSAI